ncbi:MAG: hypothetical protein ACRDYC_04575, partial [Acidimicrobiales bacterium]
MKDLAKAMLTGPLGFIPGVSGLLSHVPLIGGLFGSAKGHASGGVYAGGGAVANQPTAIFGEGNTAHPEYILPTDPTYRGRAQGLYAELGTHLFAEGGTTSGQALTGSGTGFLRVLAQIASGDPTGLLRSLIGSSTSVASLGTARKNIDATIGASVGSSGLRGLLYGVN